MTAKLSGVIAAITTPLQADGGIDTDRFLARARRLLANGCDGLNILGTTGEATSFPVAERERLMRAAAADLPTERLMVGTGAAATADAVHLTEVAAELGFAGALLLPPFYYKPVSDAGVIAYFDAIVEATADRPVPLYLYNFPALTGVPYTPALVSALMERFGERIAGLKDSSGALDYARSIVALSPTLAVFPSSEANLLLARDGAFAGCISATANLNARLCARAFHDGDEAALARAVEVRQLFDGVPLVPGIKALVGHIENDAEWSRTAPPLAALSGADTRVLAERYDAVLAGDLAHAPSVA